MCFLLSIFADFKGQEIAIRNETDYRLFHSNYYIHFRLNTIYVTFDETDSMDSQSDDAKPMKQEHNYCRSISEAESSSNENDDAKRKMHLSKQLRDRIKGLSSSFIGVISQLEDIANIVDQLSSDVKESEKTGVNASTSTSVTEMHDKSIGVSDENFVATEVEQQVVEQDVVVNDANQESTDSEDSIDETYSEDSAVESDSENLADETGSESVEIIDEWAFIESETSQTSGGSNIKPHIIPEIKIQPPSMEMVESKEQNLEPKVLELENPLSEENLAKAEVEQQVVNDQNRKSKRELDSSAETIDQIEYNLRETIEVENSEKSDESYEKLHELSEENETLSATSSFVVDDSDEEDFEGSFVTSDNLQTSSIASSSDCNSNESSEGDSDESEDYSPFVTLEDAPTSSSDSNLDCSLIQSSDLRSNCGSTESSNDDRDYAEDCSPFVTLEDFETALPEKAENASFFLLEDSLSDSSSDDSSTESSDDDSEEAEFIDEPLVTLENSQIDTEANGSAYQNNDKSFSVNGSDISGNTAEVSQTSNPLLSGSSHKSMLFLKICKHILSNSISNYSGPQSI